MGTVNVSGTVTYNGQPLTTGNVVFVPVAAEEGRSARGEIDAEGRFQLTTLKTGDGALPGQYKVTVFRYHPGSGSSEGMIAPAVGPPAIPARYLDAKTTDLTATIGDSATEVNLELHD